MSAMKKGAAKPKAKRAAKAKKAEPSQETPKKQPRPWAEGDYRLWVEGHKKAKCPQTLKQLCVVMQKWTFKWWLWAREVTDALNNGTCCTKADVMWPPFPLEHCPPSSNAVAAILRRWEAEMTVWGWDVDVNLKDCFRSWRGGGKLPKQASFPDPPRKLRPKTLQDVCKEINAYGKAMEKWGKDVKKMLDQQGCETGDSDPVSDPPPPPFD